MITAQIFVHLYLVDPSSCGPCERVGTQRLKQLHGIDILQVELRLLKDANEVRCWDTTVAYIETFRSANENER